MTKTKATIVKTSKGNTFIFVGIEAKDSTDLHQKIPNQVICIQEGSITIVQNPKGGLLLLGPAGALSNDCSPKSITIAGVHFPEDTIKSIKVMDCSLIEPIYN